MSSDMMLICEEDDSGYKGAGNEKAIFIDECGMGEPWHKFGVWFVNRFCGSPDILAQLYGVTAHNFTEITAADCVAVKSAIETMDLHEGMNKQAVIEFFDENIGKHISTENW